MSRIDQPRRAWQAWRPRVRATPGWAGALGLVALAAVVTWLVVWGPSARSLRLTTQPAPVVPLPLTVLPRDGAAPAPSDPPGPSAETRPVLRAPAEFAVQAGPFPSAAAADEAEAECSRLGQSTVRFRQPDSTRQFVVAATGFGSAAEAQAAVRQLGRGTVVEQDGAHEVHVAQHGSLGEATAAAGSLRERGFPVQVRETVQPSTAYHLRAGRFADRAEAEGLRQALARRGIQGRVVKVR